MVKSSYSFGVDIIEQVCILRPYLKTKHITSEHSEEYRLLEAAGLAVSLGLKPVHLEKVTLSEFKPGTLIGQGKIEEISEIIKNHNITLVIIDEKLAPVQQRNLEKEWQVKVIDRTGLILEIFAMRARTNEGKLQVRLAELEYQKSRLVRSWTHLERQRGGLGTIGGPGETQIEADRRMIRNEIAKIRKQLDKVVQTRELHRKKRQDFPYPIVALVGYTNAGKSTLFNLLTNANVLAEDMLFATLDPTLRLLTLPSKRKVILSDTVGFISELPPELVAAFRATLEEVVSADLLLHVRDFSSPETELQKLDVNQILKSLGIDEQNIRKQIEVLNKIDLSQDIDAIQRFRKSDNIVAISATKNTNIGELLDKIDKYLGANEEIRKVKIPILAGKLVNFIYDHSIVLARKEVEDYIELQIKISSANWQKYKSFKGEL